MQHFKWKYYFQEPPNVEPESPAPPLSPQPAAPTNLPPVIKPFLNGGGLIDFICCCINITIRQ